MSNDKVTSLKLITGEEIICTVVSSGDTIEIKKPLVLSVQQVGQGQFGLALSPWALSNPDIGLITLDKSVIVANFVPSKEVKRQYLLQTTGIDLGAPSSLKL